MFCGYLQFGLRKIVIMRRIWFLYLLIIKVTENKGMELDTIKNIREERDNIREQIKNLDLKEYDNIRYGNEEEYTLKLLINEIESLLTDISTLTKHPSKFIRISTYNERKRIFSYLEEIAYDISLPSRYIIEFEELKTLLRSYNIRNSSERLIEFEKEIEEVKEVKTQLQQVLIESKELKENINSNNLSIEEKLIKSNYRLQEIKKELDQLLIHKDELIKESERLEEINQELDSIKDEATENLDKITKSLNESKSNEKLITSFGDKVLERESRLDTLEQRTQKYYAKLDEYEEERKVIMEKAIQLINSSKKALNYTTAEGISASFQSQYEKADNKWVFGSWIFGAVICLVLTVILGIWVLEASSGNINILIGRISLLPLPIIGTVFCANQYTKQKNIIEDYAYKMVLSKAIVGFSEQLKKNGTDDNKEYVHYIKTALEEIHKDPLRKRESRRSSNNSKESNLNELVEVAEKIIKITKLD